MKNFAILTSVLALAACGGGSGGGSSVESPVSPVVSVPESMRSAAVSETVANGNTEITSMKSQIVVASNSNSPVMARVPTTVTQNGVTFTSYRLDDVKLYTAEDLNEDDAHPEKRSYLQLELNEETGRIDAIKMKVGDAESGRTVRSETDSRVFEGPIFEYVADGDDRALYRVVDTGQNMSDLTALEPQNHLSGGHWNRVDERMDVETYGKDIGNGVKLQYSDFGHFNPVYRQKNKELNEEVLTKIRNDQDPGRGEAFDKKRTDEQFNEELAKEDYQLFAGGYAIQGTNMKDTLTPDNGAEYKGMAIGRVYTSIQGTGAKRADHFAAYGITGDGHDMAKAYMTKDATMKISADGTKQTLVMPFYTKSATADKFYDITIEKQAGDLKRLDFVAANENEIDAMYRTYDALDTNDQGEFKYVDFDKSDFKPGYYGVNTASEAAGTAQLYSERNFEDGVRREYEVQAAYGMKKQ